MAVEDAEDAVAGAQQDQVSVLHAGPPAVPRRVSMVVGRVTSPSDADDRRKMVDWKQGKQRQRGAGTKL